MSAVQWRRPRGLRRPGFFTTEVLCVSITANWLPLVNCYDPPRTKVVTYTALGIDSNGCLVGAVPPATRTRRRRLVVNDQSSYPHVCRTCARYATLKEVRTELCADCGGYIVHDKRAADSYLRRERLRWLDFGAPQ